MAKIVPSASQGRSKKHPNKRNKNDGVKVVFDPPVGHAPMSEILIAFAEPFLDLFPHDLDFDEIKLLLDIAGTAWNVEVLSRYDDANVEQLLSDIQAVRARFEGDDGASLVEALLGSGFEELRRRKREQFASDERFILEITLKLTRGGSVRVQVVSTLLSSIRLEQPAEPTRERTLRREKNSNQPG